MQRWKNIWNSYKLSSESHFSPDQLCVLHSNIDFAVPDIPATGDIDDYFGVDENYNENNDAIVLPQVELNPIRCPLSDQQLHMFQSSITPFENTTKDFVAMSIYIQRAIDALNIYLSIV